MNLLRRPVLLRSLTILLSVLASYGFIPQRAYGDIVSCSNGVEIQQYIMGSDVVVDFAQGNEVMTVSLEAGSTPMYDRVTVDDQLVFEFWWRYNSQGEKVLDYSTVSFQGMTATRDGSQLVAPHRQAEEVDGESQEEELHPAAAAQINLVSYAMGQLHSSSFGAAIANTQSELQSNGIVACILSIVAWIVTVFSLAACATVVACIPVLLGHVAAGVSVGCTCGNGDC